MSAAGAPSRGSSSARVPGVHLPIMIAEVLEHLRPRPGEVAVDCTLGGGGHARAILEALQPGGRLIGLDVDPLELPRTEARLRAEGFGADQFVARHHSFAALPEVLSAEGIGSADVVLADLGVSSMQHDTPSRGFSYKGVGPLDLRMNPQAGEPASALARAAERGGSGGHPHRQCRRASGAVHRAAPEAAAGRDHARVRAPGPHRADRRDASPVEGGGEDVGAPHLPGAAHRGERRVRGAGRAPAVVAAVSGAGRPGR